MPPRHKDLFAVLITTDENETKPHLLAGGTNHVEVSRILCCIARF